MGIIESAPKRTPFHIKYNVLALISTTVSALVSMVSIRVIGVSVENDVLYLSQLVLVSLTMVTMLFTEQFLIFFNEALLESAEAAEGFYCAVMTVVSVLQAALTALCAVCMPLLIGIFARGLDEVRSTSLQTALLIQLAGFLLVPGNTINAMVLNANKRYSLPYLLQLIPLVASGIVYAGLWIAESKDINILIAAQVAANAVVFAIQGVLVLKLGIRYRPKFSDRRLKKYLVGSFLMRFGHNINNMLIQPLISNCLAALPEGNASSYSFSQKFITILNGIIIGPNQNILKAEISRLWASRAIHQVGDKIKHYYRSTLTLLFPMGIAIYLLIPLGLWVISAGRIMGDQALLIQRLFLLFCAWSLQMVIEMPFVQVIIASKKSVFFIIENSINITIIAVSLWVGWPSLGLVSIPIALIVGQGFNNVVNIWFAVRLLKRGIQ